jgi:metal-responsive CopG/Arc/MetJ family transcriptional regulator
MIRLSERYRKAIKSIIQNREDYNSAYLRIDGVIEVIVYDNNASCRELKIAQRLRRNYLMRTEK